jgi:hypothetical protein
VREAIAAKIVTFSYIPSEENFADVLTKPLSIQAHHHLVKQWLFRKADVIMNAVREQVEENLKVEQQDVTQE